MSHAIMRFSSMVPPMIVSSHSFSGKNAQKPHQKAMRLRPMFAFRGRKRKRHLRKIASRSYVKIKHCEIKQNSEIREHVHFELLLNVKGCLSMTRIEMDYNLKNSSQPFRIKLELCRKRTKNWSYFVFPLMELFDRLNLTQDDWEYFVIISALLL